MLQLFFLPFFPMFLLKYLNTFSIVDVIIFKKTSLLLKNLTETIKYFP